MLKTPLHSNVTGEFILTHCNLNLRIHSLLISRLLIFRYTKIKIVICIKRHNYDRSEILRFIINNAVSNAV